MISFQKDLSKVSQIFLFFYFLSDKESIKVHCGPCSIDDEHVEATHFCKTCEDPEPLCGTCAKHHLKQKLSKNHEMCTDIDQFRNEKKMERYFLELSRTKHSWQRLSFSDNCFKKTFSAFFLAHLNRKFK